MVGFLVHFFSLFALAIWVGGGVGIGFIAAPMVFQRAGSRRLAGEIVGQILRRFDIWRLSAGSVALVVTVLEMVGTVGAGQIFSLRLVMIVTMLALALYARSALAPEIQRLRAELGDDLDRVPRDDPRRVAFAKLHGYSVLCLMGELLLGAFAMALAVMTMTVRVG